LSLGSVLELDVMPRVGLLRFGWRFRFRRGILRSFSLRRLHLCLGLLALLFEIPGLDRRKLQAVEEQRLNQHLLRTDGLTLAIHDQGYQ